MANNISFTALVGTAAWGAELATALAGSEEWGDTYVGELPSRDGHAPRC